MKGKKSVGLIQYIPSKIVLEKNPGTDPVKLFHMYGTLGQLLDKTKWQKDDQ
jgi:hypothetical protein